MADEYKLHLVFAGNPAKKRENDTEEMIYVKVGAVDAQRYIKQTNLTHMLLVRHHVPDIVKDAVLRQLRNVFPRSEFNLDLRELQLGWDKSFTDDELEKSMARAGGTYIAAYKHLGAKQIPTLDSLELDTKGKLVSINFHSLVAGRSEERSLSEFELDPVEFVRKYGLTTDQNQDLERRLKEMGKELKYFTV